MDEFIYEHGIVLPMNTTDATVITVVLLFNCALAHQLAARHCNYGSPTKALLERAESLYQIAYNGQALGLKNTIFKLAILNNVGVIHNTLGRGEAAKASFDRLVSLMMCYIIDSRNNKKHLRLVQSFWNNVWGGIQETAPSA
mmetsp:Transcript_35135/g.85084  ORF Transcript_35135/g.85084 Transcript_35135/m.85084 type:complete len:142 (-) Transcript_35135:450-875(-)